MSKGFFCNWTVSFSLTGYLLLNLITFVSPQSCFNVITSGNSGVNVTATAEHLVADGKRFSLLFPQLVFQCSGTITNIRIQVNGIKDCTSIEPTIVFQIWAPVAGSSNVYQLMDAHTAMISGSEAKQQCLKQEGTIKNFNIPLSIGFGGLLVQKGFIIGMHLSGNMNLVYLKSTSPPLLLDTSSDAPEVGSTALFIRNESLLGFAPKIDFSFDAASFQIALPEQDGQSDHTDHTVMVATGSILLALALFNTICLIVMWKYVTKVKCERRCKDPDRYYTYPRPLVIPSKPPQDSRRNCPGPTGTTAKAHKRSQSVSQLTNRANFQLRSSHSISGPTALSVSSSQTPERSNSDTSSGGRERPAAYMQPLPNHEYYNCPKKTGKGRTDSTNDETCYYYCEYTQDRETDPSTYYI